MLFLLAWRNVWRNVKRSTIIIVSIALGLAGGLFAGAVMMGMGESMINSAIDRNLGHLQIHSPAYRRDALVSNYIRSPQKVLSLLDTLGSVKAYSARTLLEGMASSANSSYGVTITGVDPERERETTALVSMLVAGNFLADKYRTQAVIGKKLAERLGLKLKSKIILTFQDRSGEIVYMAARIVGLFKTESTAFDEMTVFVRQKDVTRLLGARKPLIHEIAIRLKNSSTLPATKARLASGFSDLKVEEWREIAPELAFMSTSVESFTYLFVAIIIFALIFGITNTMLMAVMERIHELGILMAVGMKRGRVFIMILMETLLLSFVGGMLGMLIGGAAIAWFNHFGIDLSAFAQGLEGFGSGTILYPYLPGVMYAALTVMIVVAANISALMPAWKAVRLKPAQAVRVY